MERMALRLWEKHKFLGAGSFGTVHLAAPVGSSRLSTYLAAVKSADIDSSSSLQKEAAFLKELRGKPNIIQCFGEDISLEEDENVYNLILEYALGGSLHDLIQKNKGTIPESHIAFYVLMLLRGISAMHERNIVHCDLKPGNILVFPTSDGMNELKIADFGLSKKEWEEPIIEPRYGGSIFCLGTPVYAAPESAGYGVHNKASDIWSLGCIVLEMITGNRIWFCKDVEDLVYVTVFGKPKEKIPENLSEHGKDFLKRCLKRNPDMRWTAKKLMDHPFIVQNMKLLDGDHYPRQSQTNPFGRWISTVDLFATSSSDDEAQCSPCVLQSIPW